MAENDLVAIVLAAGYGTRLEADLRAAAEKQSSDISSFSYLLGIPKPLLPVGGKLLLNYWTDQFQAVNQFIKKTYIVTNDIHYPLFRNWAKMNNFPEENIINDGSSSNATRLGAVADLELVIASKGITSDVLVVAGDTLFFPHDPNAQLTTILNEFYKEKDDIVLCYDLKSDLLAAQALQEDVRKRGIIETDVHGFITRFWEKPDPSGTRSRLACPPFYVYSRKNLHLLKQFLADKKEQPLEMRDAPGQYMAWLAMRVPVRAWRIAGRFDIGNLEQYKEAQMYFSSAIQNQPLIEMVRKNQIVCRSYARVGLMGNPSDGFAGKTISFTMQNHFAEVVLWESDKLCFLSHPKHDGTVFKDLFHLVEWIEQETYSGGIRLMKATCKKFVQFCLDRGLLSPAALKRNFTLKYDTNIPRQVGLGGSSAIVSACMKCLVRFYGLTTDDISKATLSWLVLCVEQEELGITAGLQDRVIQVYEGLVHMDFTPKDLKDYVYTQMDSRLLPKFFITFVAKKPKDSGKVHNNIRQRWLAGEAEIVEGMKVFADLTDKAKVAIEKQDCTALGELMNQNFAQRRKIYGDEVVGKTNLRMIEICYAHHAYAKFPGSGGCIVGLATSQTDVAKLRDALDAEGFKYEELEIHHATQ